MQIGNWKNHILVKCVVCLKPMGHHVSTETATCNDCESVSQSFRYLRSKQTGQMIKQHKQWNGVEDVYLPINKFWMEV